MYILDSNFFIQAHRSHYPLDVFPSFWNKIKSLAEDGKVLCIDKVKDELYKNEDALKLWCCDNLTDGFFRDSSNVLQAYSSVVGWAVSRSHHYSQAAINEFLAADEADAWLVSHALESSCTIVTHEVSNPNQKSKVKIPEACITFGVPFINTVELFRRLSVSF